MRLKREQAANAPQGQNTVVVVNSGGNAFPIWKLGSEAEGRGFNWKTKQKMVQQWEQYQLSEGLHAPKSFKSMIDHDLIPVICASCNLEEGEWETIDDVTLLSAIEEQLRPHDSMDFAVQLKQIKFETDEAKGTLTQRYRIFAEAFLAKVSEAKAAGCELEQNVVKLAFTRAAQADPILQGWLEQQKWTTAGETHRRISSHLKMVDAYQTLAGLGIKGSARLEGASTQPNQQQQGQHQQQQRYRQNYQHQEQQQHQHQQQDQQQQQSHPPAQQPPAHNMSRNEARRQQQQLNITQQVTSAVNAALAAFQQTQVQQQHRVPLQQPATDAAMVNAMSQQTQHALPPFPGLDVRGLNWHIHSPLLECRCIPCLGKFCQACGIHGHTVENCRKRLFHNPGANKSGYWSEQQPGRAPMRMPGLPPPMVNAATSHGAPVPPFPTPFRMNTPASNAAVNASEGQRQDQQSQTQNAQQQRVRFAETGQQAQPTASVNNTQPPTSPTNKQE
jgi:hypothetical protein